MNYYDIENKRLLVLAEKATSDFWDKHWQAAALEEKDIKRGADRIVKKISKKFLLPGAKILEGGCGQGQNVYGLNSFGYDCYGVDFAKETISQVKKIIPTLKVSVENLECLSFPDNFFDGYWCLGVIEHDIRGYEYIIKEIQRVLRPGGYLFLTFPHMSFLRRLKVFLKRYPFWQGELGKDNFYEFIFSAKNVRQDISSYGFHLCYQRSFDAIKGLKDETVLFRSFLVKIYRRKDIVAKVFRYVFSKLFSSLTGHAKLMVFQKI